MDYSTPTQTTPGTEHEVPAAGHLASHLRFWLATVLVLIFDLWTKAWSFNVLPADDAKTIIPGWLEFRRSLNDGAVFGSFTGYTWLFVIASIVALGFVVYIFLHSARTQWMLQLALGLILAGAIGNLYDRLFIKADIVVVRDPDGYEYTVIGVLLSEPEAGWIKLGAWPDGDHPKVFKKDEVKLRRQGVVRDFIKFVPNFPEWVPRLGGRDLWPWVFNIADAALVVGVTVLLIPVFFGGRSRHRKVPQP
jgi:lipoprotein signal peptidase